MVFNSNDPAPYTIYDIDNMIYNYIILTRFENLEGKLCVRHRYQALPGKILQN